MSTNIRLKRICSLCGKQFEAKTTVTRYCSLQCAQKGYKLRKRQEKSLLSNQETQEIIQKSLSVIKEKEFLSVRDVAKLIGCSRQAVYLMIKSGRLRAVNLNKKKTIVKRSSIDELFEQGAESPALSEPEPKQVDVDDCYNLSEVQSKFGISEKALYDLIKRNGLLKIKIGRYAYVQKDEIDRLLNG
jgi:excisionase family DNA binding protein